MAVDRAGARFGAGGCRIWTAAAGEPCDRCERRRDDARRQHLVGQHAISGTWGGTRERAVCRAWSCLTERSGGRGPDAGGAAIATDHALYLLTATSRGVPRITWRAAYDRGPYRKPGQLSHGTGATPVFFAPRTGTEYLAITDNALPAGKITNTNKNRRPEVTTPTGSTPQRRTRQPRDTWSRVGGRAFQ